MQGAGACAQPCGARVGPCGGGRAPRTTRRTKNTLAVPAPQVARRRAARSVPPGPRCLAAALPPFARSAVRVAGGANGRFAPSSTASYLAEGGGRGVAAPPRPFFLAPDFPPHYGSDDTGSLPAIHAALLRAAPVRVTRQRSLAAELLLLVADTSPGQAASALYCSRLPGVSAGSTPRGARCHAVARTCFPSPWRSCGWCGVGGPH